MDGDLHEIIAALPRIEWSGTIYRHMLGQIPPDRQNTKGARWNPPNVPAIYASTTREGAIAEGAYSISQQPIAPSVKRVVYGLSVTIPKLIDISAEAVLGRLGLDLSDVASPDFSGCQKVGGVADWDGVAGMLVPSARSAWPNIVLFARHMSLDTEFEVVSRETLPPLHR